MDRRVRRVGASSWITAYRRHGWACPGHLA